MPISHKQKQILAFPYTTKYQALICDGAVRSGKTSIMTVAFVDWAMREFSGCNFAICGKTVGSAIKNIIVPYMALSYAKQRYSITFTRSDNKMVVRRGGRTNWKQLRKEIAKRLKVVESEVERLYDIASQRTYMDDVRRLSPSMQDWAKDPTMQQITQAARALAGDELHNITQTMGMIDTRGRELPLREFYGKTMDFVHNNVMMGTMDYNTAVRMAAAHLAEKGVTSIGYESGVVTSLEAAVRRNVMGGLGLMVEQISGYMHDETGANGWEISAHAMSAPDHEPIQGRQYSDAEYMKLNGRLKRRIGTLNCGHTAFPIILGVNEPAHSDAELRKFKDENAAGVTIGDKHYTLYEATQKQRGLERDIRKWKRRNLAAQSSGDIDATQITASKLRNIQREYNVYSKAAGLRTSGSRIEVTGFGSKEATAANRAATGLDKRRQAEYNKAVEEARKAIAENPKTIVAGQQNKHIVGTHEYEQYVKRLHDRGQYGPSRIYGGISDAQVLVDKYAGMGEIRIENGKWLKYEIINTGGAPIGIVVNNITGDAPETTLFKIHYQKSGVHIVPDYPSKRRRGN